MFFTVIGIVFNKRDILPYTKGRLLYERPFTYTIGRIETLRRMIQTFDYRRNILPKGKKVRFFDGRPGQNSDRHISFGQGCHIEGLFSVPGTVNLASFHEERSVGSSVLKPEPEFS